MRAHKNSIRIVSRNYWFKIVDFLQTNWSLIDEQEDGSACVWFFSDTSIVFDEKAFDTLEEAVNWLMDEGFDLYDQNDEVKESISPPKQPIKRVTHSN